MFYFFCFIFYVDREGRLFSFLLSSRIRHWNSNVKISCMNRYTWTCIRYEPYSRHAIYKNYIISSRHYEFDKLLKKRNEFDGLKVNVHISYTIILYNAATRSFVFTTALSVRSIGGGSFATTRVIVGLSGAVCRQLICDCTETLRCR